MSVWCICLMYLFDVPAGIHEHLAPLIGLIECAYKLCQVNFVLSKASIRFKRQFQFETFKSLLFTYFKMVQIEVRFEVWIVLDRLCFRLHSINGGKFLVSFESPNQTLIRSSLNILLISSIKKFWLFYFCIFSLCIFLNLKCYQDSLPHLHRLSMLSIQPFISMF